MTEQHYPTTTQAADGRLAAQLGGCAREARAHSGARAITTLYDVVVDGVKVTLAV